MSQAAEMCMGRRAKVVKLVPFFNGLRGFFGFAVRVWLLCTALLLCF